MRWWIAIAVWLLATTALAKVDVPIPRAWTTDPAPGARARAQAWASAAGADLVRVASTRDRDDFAETLAVLRVAAPMPTDEDARAMLQATAREALEVDSEPTAFVTVSNGEELPALIRGRFEHDEVTYLLVLVNEGPTHAIVVAAVKSAEESLYAAALASLAEGITGAVPRVSAFDLTSLRVGVVFGWIAFGVVTWLVVLRLQDASTLQRGRTVAGSCAIAAVVVGLTFYFASATDERSLAQAGVSRGWVATEVALTGLAAAAGALIFAAVRQGTSRQIQSAPVGGVFRKNPSRPDPSLVPSAGAVAANGPAPTSPVAATPVLTPPGAGEANDARPRLTDAVEGGVTKFPPPY